MPERGVVVRAEWSCFLAARSRPRLTKRQRRCCWREAAARTSRGGLAMAAVCVKGLGEVRAAMADGPDAPPRRDRGSFVFFFYDPTSLH